MRSLLAVLVVAALVAPAHGEFFEVTADGSFNTYRSPNNGIEGYSNAGAKTVARIGKTNQHNGWLSFRGATADGTGASLADVVASYGANAQAFIYLKMDSALPVGTGVYALSIRTGNEGGLVEDADTTGIGTQAAPAAGFTGASELVAWRGAAPYPGTGFLKFGSGIYTVDDPTSELGTHGVPWKTPSTRQPNTGAAPFRWGPNEEVRYDTGVMQTSDGQTAPTGKYLGFFPDPNGGTVGRSYWALEDVLGMYVNKAGATSLANITAAGQILIGGNDTPTLIDGSLMDVVNADPRNGTVGNWLKIPVDLAFLLDMANNDEHKGIYFANNIAGLTQNWGNQGFYTKESGSASAPYLYITPEPATMILLALGGLVAVRRRA